MGALDGEKAAFAKEMGLEKARRLDEDQEGGCSRHQELEDKSGRRKQRNDLVPSADCNDVLLHSSLR